MNFPFDKDIKLFYEKQSVKRAANLSGAAYCAMNILSFILSIAVTFAATAILGYKKSLELLEEPNFLMLLQIVLSSLMFTLPFSIVAKAGRYKISAICEYKAPKKELFWPLAALGLGFCTVGEIMTNIFASTMSFFGIEPAGASLEFGDGLFGIILSTVGVAIIPPLVEEFAMRGVVMGMFRRFGDGFAILVSAMLFGFMHGNLVQIPFAFVAGLGLAFVAIKSGSIWTAVFVHLLNNATAVLEEYLFRGLSEGTQQVIYLLIIAVYLIIGILGLIVAHRRDGELFVLRKPDMEATLSRKIGWFFASPFIIVSLIFTVIQIIIVQVGF